MWQVLFWLLMVAAAMLAGVSTNVSAPPSTSGGTTPPAAAAPADAVTGASPLAEAISFAPADATLLNFTDWSAIKRYEGAENISSRSSMDDRIDLLMSTTRGQAAASGFALPYMEQQAALWGWDSTDLLWEATITTAGGPPVYVLRLPDDFDMDGLVARFEERGFARSEQGTRSFLPTI